ncbi:Uu.00g144910.m01.CDS01 [Anthostomella pinea]|uniref:Uu.00g144910.m01.CDS01 n=1 Tax=Anthostomella pinea TaxID=933095 RepID=A0AAI8VQZ7_9PEZI|nr:Uu.00g144910.m01.CDS01 [Anthostomella pinea]
MNSITSVGPSRPRSILKKRSSVGLDVRTRSPSPSSPPSSPSSIARKSAAFDEVARDIMTGAEVPQSPMSGREYRAWHKGYRQAVGKALLLARIEGMYEEVVRRVDVREES